MPEAQALFHCVSRNFLRNAGTNGDLAGGVGTSSGLASVAEDGFFDLSRIDRCAFSEVRLWRRPRPCQRRKAMRAKPPEFSGIGVRTADTM